jgi:hypothetical protein
MSTRALKREIAGLSAERQEILQNVIHLTQLRDQACLRLLQEHGWDQNMALNHHYGPDLGDRGARHRPEADMRQVGAIAAKPRWYCRIMARFLRSVCNHPWVVLAILVYIIVKIVGFPPSLVYLGMLAAWVFKRLPASCQLILAAIVAILFPQWMNLFKDMYGDNFDKWVNGLPVRWKRGTPVRVQTGMAEEGGSKHGS